MVFCSTDAILAVCYIWVRTGWCRVSRNQASVVDLGCGLHCADRLGSWSSDSIKQPVETSLHRIMVGGA